VIDLPISGAGQLYWCIHAMWLSTSLQSGTILMITIATTAALNLPQDTGRILAASEGQNDSNPGFIIVPQTTNTTTAAGSLSLSNTTSSDIGLTAGKVQIQCTYGHQVETVACLDALHTFTSGFRKSEFTIGDRATGDWDLNLPIRWISGT
jgi:hypothetical protein